MTEIHLAFPYREKAVRKLRIGDVVYITGEIHTMRDMGYRRALDLLSQGARLPADLKEGALWHCGPVVAVNDGKWQMVSAGSTTSSRFTDLAAALTEQLNIRITLGKGTMGPAAAKAIAKTGSCYLSTTGGCAALYTQQIRQVIAANWLDLGYPEALWSLDVADFGPLM
ncbi:MAG: fumarate hydratase, partial [Methanomicrobiales archaeon HGW-Methanomicrobiales-5]